MDLAPRFENRLARIDQSTAGIASTRVPTQSAPDGIEPTLCRITLGESSICGGGTDLCLPATVELAPQDQKAQGWVVPWRNLNVLAVQVVRHVGTRFGVPRFVSAVEPGSRSSLIGRITLDMKCGGARSSGNPHATCERPNLRNYGAIPRSDERPAC